MWAREMTTKKTCSKEDMRSEKKRLMNMYLICEMSQVVREKRAVCKRISCQPSPVIKP